MPPSLLDFVGRAVIVSFAFASSIGGCGGKEPSPAPVAGTPSAADRGVSAAPPAAAAPRDDRADPHDPHDPHGPGGKMTEPQPFVRTAQGTIELTIDGTPQRIGHLPYGRNAAVWSEKNGIARITIGGSESGGGHPTLSITVSGVKLDDAELPLTIGAGKPAGAKRPGSAAKSARITWQVGERRVYRSREAGEDGAPKIVLESYADGRLEGTFEGALAMGESKLDPPLRVRGTFDVSLRLNGVAPNRGT